MLSAITRNNTDAEDVNNHRNNHGKTVNVRNSVEICLLLTKVIKILSTTFYSNDLDLLN